MTEPHSAGDTPFRLEEATIDAAASGDPRGPDYLRRGRPALHRARRAYNGVASMLVTEDGAAIPRGHGRGARASAAPFSDRDRQGLVHLAGPRQDTAARRSNSAGWRRPPPIPTVQQQYGMIAGIPNAGQAERAGHAQHPRRALGDLQRRVRPPSVAGTVAARRAARLRDVPPTARRARARRRA